MKKNSCYMLIAGIFLCLLSCTEQQSDNTIPTIWIDPDKVEDNIDISFLVEDDFEIVKLETTDKVLISDIEKVIFKYNRFFIFEENQASIDPGARNLYSFTDEGKFICKIGVRGEGPEEYYRIEDVDVENECVYLLDMLGDVLVFDLNGNYKQRMSFSDDFSPNEFIVDENGMFFVDSYTPSSYGSYLFYHYDFRSGEMSKQLPFDEKAVRSTWGVDHISEYKDEKLIIYPLDHKVYQLKDTVLTPQYQIRFSSRELPEELKTEDVLTLMTTASKNRYLWGVGKLLNLGKYLLADYTDGNRGMNVLIDKDVLSSSVTFGVVMDNLGKLCPIDIFQKDDMLFVVHGAEQFKDFHERAYSTQTFKHEKDRLRFQKLADELTGDENPIIFKFKLKE